MVGMRDVPGYTMVGMRDVPGYTPPPYHAGIHHPTMPPSIHSWVYHHASQCHCVCTGGSARSATMRGEVPGLKTEINNGYKAQGGLSLLFPVEVGRELCA